MTNLKWKMENGKSSSLNSARPSRHYRSVGPEQKHRAENGSDPAGRVTRSSPERAPDECPKQRAGHPDNCGPNDSSGVAARHQQLRNNADYQPENDLPYQVHHKLVLLLLLRGATSEARLYLFLLRTALYNGATPPPTCDAGEMSPRLTVSNHCNHHTTARRRADDDWLFMIGN